jgi:hypothetical protein
MIHDRSQYHRDLDRKFIDKSNRPPKNPPPLEQINTMKMTRQAYNDIKNQIGSKPAETGGLLLSKSLDYCVSDFVLDIASKKHSSIYQPNTKFLNSVLKGRNDEFVGIAHSHRNLPMLSSQDKRAAWSNMTSPGNPHLRAYLMPIIETIPDAGRFRIIPFIVTCHPKGKGRVIVSKVGLEVIGD